MTFHVFFQMGRFKVMEDGRWKMELQEVIYGSESVDGDDNSLITHSKESSINHHIPGPLV